MPALVAVVDGNNAQIAAINALAAERQVKIPVLIDSSTSCSTCGRQRTASSTPATPQPAPGQGAGRQDPGRQAPRRPRRIRRRATAFGYSPQERAGADACADYLENKQDYLDYPAFLTGRPVASGLIEGAARWLVKDRMQVTGARWSLDGAEAVLRLRALAGNGDFDDYFTFHREQEKRRNHDNRYQQPQTRAA